MKTMARAGWLSALVILALPLLVPPVSRAAKPAAGEAAPPTGAADPLDWPNWRGPEQNNSSREKGLVDSWNPKGGPGSNLLWKRSDLGTRSTPIVMRGKLYTLARSEPETPREGERVVCVDAATGETIWEYRFNVYLSEVPDTRVGWSCVVGDPETGHVYALGVCGYFACLDGETGKVIWDKSLHEEYGFLSTYGGRTNVPVVFEDLVLISAVVIGWDEMARPAHRFMAFDKATGEMRWFNGTRPNPYDTNYSTPVLCVLGGQAAITFASGDGQAWAMQPRTGKPLWNYDMSRRGINTSPLVVGDTVYACHSEENVAGALMGNLVAIDGAGHGDLTKKPIWQQIGVAVGKASPVMVGDHLVTIDDGSKLFIHDTKSGEIIRKMSLGRAQRSTPLVADGKLYTISQSGEWHIVAIDDEGAGKIVHKLRLSREEADGSPIVSHGRIYLPTSLNLYCIGQKDHKPEADPIPPGPAETPVADTDEPAQVQVVPCEVLLAPGQTQKFRVRLYSERGQFLKESLAQFSVNGPGEVSDDGTYTAPSEPEHAGVKVSAKVGEKLTGVARVRVVPPLPWKWDFNNAKDVPITWLGGRVRYVVREVDGEQIAVKRNELPTATGKTTKLGTLSYLWMGPKDLHDYTVQADVQGTLFNGKMPDVGLINQRYTLYLYGAGQTLAINDWAPQERIKKSVPFKWETGKWYTLKVRSETKDDVATIRGKAWPRGDKEPAGWQVEVVDKQPNLTGSPGLFGNAKDAEIYLDNITVTANK